LRRSIRVREAGEFMKSPIWTLAHIQFLYSEAMKKYVVKGGKF